MFLKKIQYTIKHNFQTTYMLCYYLKPSNNF
nr:MAG TPA: hypothetical protein [Caudoviricetes sp.]